jgi:hypothetical protein
MLGVVLRHFYSTVWKMVAKGINPIAIIHWTGRRGGGAGHTLRISNSSSDSNSLSDDSMNSVQKENRQ